MKILIFVENNVLNSNNFEPIEGAKEKIQEWMGLGAQVEFITGIYKFLDLKNLTDEIKKLDISEPKIHAKQEGEKYLDIIDQVSPDILIENEFNSGEEKLCKDRIKPETKIACIVLRSGQSLKNLAVDPKEIKEDALEKDEVPNDQTY